MEGPTKNQVDNSTDFIHWKEEILSALCHPGLDPRTEKGINGKISDIQTRMAAQAWSPSTGVVEARRSGVQNPSGLPEPPPKRPSRPGL